MRHFISLAVICSLCPSAFADVELSRLFSDHMVMQRDKPVPVWGWATPGEKITVTIDQQRKNTLAQEDGKWMVRLDPLKTGDSRAMTVTGKNRSLSG